jgi:hypothetical protein
MSILVNCPSCERKLKVPDELLGKKVKCPGCATIFTAEEIEETVASEEEAPRQPRRPAREEESLEEERPRRAARRSSPPPDEDDYDDEMEIRPRRRGRSRAREAVNGPAIGLLITGIIGVVLTLCSIGINISTMAGAAIIPRPQGPGAPPAWLNLFSGGVGLVFNAIAIFVSILIILGALKMKNLQSYGMAMAASIVAMIPCISPCCILGLPIGIWALVVLSKPEVKDTFS